jgi:hypothetical protein
MKRYNYLYIGIVTSIILFSINSCSSDEKINLSVSNENKDEEGINDNLTNIAEGISSLCQDHEFNNYVYSEIEKKFDGDYNVLFSKIDNSFNKGGMLSSKYNETSMFFDLIKKYPQIYIPFYEELKDRKILGKRSPIFLIYTDENETGKYIGYEISKAGKLSQLSFLIDEEFAENNEVWVVSVNERVDEKGLIKISNNSIEDIPLLSIPNSKSYPNNTIDVQKNMLECIPPARPGKIEIYPTLPSSIYLEWDDVLNTTYYKVYRDVNYSGVYNEIKTLDRLTEGSAWTDTHLSNGIHYSYQVQAFNTVDCYSPRTFGVGAWATWRTNNNYDILYQIYLSDDCWNWCCSWPEGNIELKYRIVKYNKADQQVEYPKSSLTQKRKKDQKGLWCTYNRDLFRWDVTKYAFNYLVFIYEDDGGDDVGTTIKLSAQFSPVDAIKIGADVTFTIDDRDEELGWIEIYQYDQFGKVYFLSPRKGAAMVTIRQ